MVDRMPNDRLLTIQVMRLVLIHKQADRDLYCSTPTIEVSDDLSRPNLDGARRISRDEKGPSWFRVCCRVKSEVRRMVGSAWIL